MVDQKYFGWGAFNGIILGISLVNGIDISEEGIITEIIKSFKPLMEQIGLSTGWITISIIFISLLGLLSLFLEAVAVYNEGGWAIFYAITGFLGFFLIIGLTGLGTIFIIAGVLGGLVKR